MRKVGCGFLFVFYSLVTIWLYLIIYEINLDIGRKSRFFHTPAFDTLLKGVPVGVYRPTVWCGKKPRMVWLPQGEKVICLALSIEHLHVTNRHLATAYSLRYA